MNRKKILCVDDEQAVLAAVIETLEEEYYVITADNGKDALAKIDEAHPDLVLMDVMMPDMDGFETATKLQTGDYRYKPPVVFFSAKTSPQDIKAGETISGYGYITKPFQPSSFIKNLECIFDALEAEKKPEEMTSILADILPL